ncbi:MAG: leucyl/phenylalanyl-tRNA--protein transferase [Campylobacterales bacterium]|nr:leucyl/phenylalanyl-tRNA--protein transferase [Campylobacterales bacterium]
MFDEDNYIITQIGMDYIFPNPRFASDEGLLAYGGDLSPNRLLKAYSKGIFPWYNAQDPILWWSPNPRMVLYPDSFKVSKSFRRRLRNNTFKVHFDRDFRSVIEHCSSTVRKGQSGRTWITSEIKEAYTKLHEMGFAHSVEAYDANDELIGGLYGISLGGGFFGESMFSLQKDGSKIALKGLSDLLLKEGFDFIDCQLTTEYLISIGAEEVDRDIFLDELDATLQRGGRIGLWSDWSWEYCDD